MSKRNQQLLCGLTKTDRIIEIGPLHSPLTPKAAGWMTTVVDHASRDALVAKYAGHQNVDPSQIQDVDIIWSEGALHDAFPAAAQGSYGWLIASHVIEHLPDVVRFLDSAARLLDPEHGVLALAVPDKRWCFDLFRPVSTTGQALAAHRARAQRHLPERLFDHHAYSAFDCGRPGWGREKLSHLQLATRLGEAKAAFDGWSDAPAAHYVDCHAWQFTPSSFELLILELGELGAADWRVDWIAPQPSTEFTAHLRRGRRQFTSPQECEARRMDLLYGIVRELREQADWLLDDSITPSVGAVMRRIDRLASRLAARPQNLHPIRSALTALLPVRRMIARWRGRI